ncbi:MAG: hypothetical protein IPJ36_03055 [Simplicispira sp.]|nr:hypothetical protein [Simplicispira sp.]
MKPCNGRRPESGSTLATGAAKTTAGCYERDGWDEEALALWRRRLQARPDVSTYRAVLTAAERAGCDRARYRAELFAWAEQREQAELDAARSAPARMQVIPHCAAYVRVLAPRTPRRSRPWRWCSNPATAAVSTRSKRWPGSCPLRTVRMPCNCCSACSTLRWPGPARPGAGA